MRQVDFLDPFSGVKPSIIFWFSIFRICFLLFPSIVNALIVARAWSPTFYQLAKLQRFISHFNSLVWYVTVSNIVSLFITLVQFVKNLFSFARIAIV